MTLLDTNVCVRFLRGKESIVRRILDADENDDLRIPAMAEGELFYGVEKSDRREENREKVKALLELLPVCHTDDETMEKFGELKAKAEAAGKRVDDADVLIAATALRYNAVLVTGNARHFSRFDGLVIEDWR
ncbi:MAG: PIN domain-containing protein [Kiritimatiellae bacterium]|nr:PIN domain-containing protein [Kiritimatiellia bacterium]